MIRKPVFAGIFLKLALPFRIKVSSVALPTNGLPFWTSAHNIYEFSVIPCHPFSNSLQLRHDIPIKDITRGYITRGCITVILPCRYIAIIPWAVPIISPIIKIIKTLALSGLAMIVSCMVLPDTSLSFVVREIFICNLLKQPQSIENLPSHCRTSL